MLKNFFADKWYFLCIFMHMCLLATKSDGFSWAALYWKFSRQGIWGGGKVECGTFLFFYCWFGKHSQQKENVRMLVLKKDGAVLWLPAAHGATSGCDNPTAQARLCQGLLQWAHCVNRARAPRRVRQSPNLPGNSAAWVGSRWEDALCSGTNLICRVLLSLHESDVRLKSTWRWQIAPWVGMLTPF